MGQVARSLQEEHGDVDATLAAITSAAVSSVPGTDACGISLVIGKRRVESRAPTSDLPRDMDRLQDELGEGPCLTSVQTQHSVRVDDVRGERRWPRFAEQAAGRGLGSLLSFQLFVTGDNLGPLNLHAGEPHAFDEEAESVGLVFASHASIALAGAQQEDRLRTAISTRDVIGQAKGILMERVKLTADQAFTVLVRASSHPNRRLGDIAEELTATGVLPQPRDPGGGG
ncbi:GAF domain-containing protein [Geodermatophilus dictyosporus]|uniref:GAF domain-containing protein n=1 Tax=Geodermatophilus dictyosporus TaxID=1523247 RepID=A0A1I5U8U4_9ACTN|nr:GAF and ANTAR domain-containing protein [Geodermatophilus dictyosporus]SFP91670.1 GAF domain-containing protein [Geodermatophilus dictyosporus]